jgi:MFS family permease
MKALKEKKKLIEVIAASSLGTLIEWYDFYIFGSLATVISTKFFPSGNPLLSLLSTLATFAAGFVVRPFGAIFFGRIGDAVGRKYTFLLTLVLMGLSTFLIGCVPSYESIGLFSPILVLFLRLIQGLALGGEYGGAATYVAEHSPDHQRGFWTSWIQTTATVGLFFSLMVIYVTKKSLNENDFNDWGWRMPFWISILMVAVSVLIRMRMKESPLFEKIKSEGKISKNPLKESFGNKLNLKFVLLALFGAVMGQGVVWYTGQFYALSFIQNTLHVEISQASTMVMWALLFATPLFVFFGYLSDKIGRKWIMLSGMLLAILCLRPIYSAMFELATVTKKTELVELKKIKSIKKWDPINGDSIFTLETKSFFSDGTISNEEIIKKISKNVVPNGPKIENKKSLVVVLDSASYWMIVLLVFVQVVFVTMVYGPIAAFLVELFPTRIRYTSMSLPYHIGNGIFGGLLPAIATFLATKAAQANDDAVKLGMKLPYEKPFLEGLWYPIIVAGVCFVIGALYINEKRNNAKD